MLKLSNWLKKSLTAPVPTPRKIACRIASPYLCMGCLSAFSEYAGNIGDAMEETEREAEQTKILQLVDKF